MAANILVVDDSATMRGMIKRTLAISGLDIGEVYEAGHGIEALAEMQGRPVNVVLLDINMPVMNGIKFLQRVSADPHLREIPVVITSTEGSQTRVRELLALGARGYVRKPFRPEQLRDALVKFVALRPVAAAPTVAGGADDQSF